MHLVLASLLVGASALVPVSGPACSVRSVPTVRRAVQPSLIAKSQEERALLAASKNVMQIARKFGYTQGVAAQDWVEASIKSKTANTDKLMQMQLTLFDECSVDDESGRCQALSEAIDAMKGAVVAKAAAAETSKKGFKLNLGPSELQVAATKVRDAATRFGPSQKEAANAWIKQVTTGMSTEGGVASEFREDLLTQKITLFGECLLSEDGSPSDCEKLDKALTEFQEAIEFCEVATAAAEEACRAAEVIKQLNDDFEAGKTVSWYDRGVRLEPAPPAAPAPVAAAAVAAPATAPKAAAAAAAPAPPSEAEFALMMALRAASVNVGVTSNIVRLENAIAAAESSGVDAEKMRVAREALGNKGKAPKEGRWY